MSGTFSGPMKTLGEDNLIAAPQFRQVWHASGIPLSSQLRPAGTGSGNFGHRQLCLWLLHCLLAPVPLSFSLTISQGKSSLAPCHLKPQPARLQAART